VPLADESNCTGCSGYLYEWQVKWEKSGYVGEIMLHANNKSCSALIITFLVFLFLTIRVGHAADENHAKLVSVHVAHYMVSGERYTVRIEYKNAGTALWNVEKNYRIDWADPALANIWGNLETQPLFSTAVAPGETALIEFEITAPEKTGLYQLSWQLVDADGNHFSEPAIAKAVRVENPNNQARVVMQLVPDQVAAGEKFTAMIQVKNIGRTTWNAASGYHLALVEPNVWSIKRLDLKPNAYIAPDETVMFKAAFTAPATTGDYQFQWQMRHNKTYFGETTPLVTVHVGGQAAAVNDAEFVYQSAAKRMLAGDTQAVVVQFKNTGDLEWRAGQIMLASPDDKGLIWAVDAVEMKPGETVKPGEFLAFRFNVQAPLDAGVYTFQWQLRDLRQGFFGQPSKKLFIEVK
jgi:hypothetical protein